MKTIRWVLIGALFAILFAGCYTKLVHPPVTDESGAYYHPRKDCSDCHSSADYYYYHFPYYFYDRWGGGRYWGSYYTNPWWYHDYWWWNGEGEGEGLPSGPTHYWDERNRPTEVPKLVPPAEGTKIKGDETPAVPGGQGSEVKEKPKTDNSGGQYYQPRTRPEQPKEEPKEQKKEEKKAEEKK
jgi:hypothetical protein